MRKDVFEKDFHGSGCRSQNDADFLVRLIPLANQYRTSVARVPNAKGLSFCQSNAESVSRNPLPKYSDTRYIKVG